MGGYLMTDMKLPKELENLLAGMAWVEDNEGMSKAKVIKYYDNKKTYYLKIEKLNKEVEREIGLYRWLMGRLPIPEIKYQAIIDDLSYLLMEKAKGEMLQEERFIKDPALLVKLAAKGLKKLWSVDISNCQFDSRIDYKLKQARYFIDSGEADHIDESEYTEGLRTVEELYNYLLEHKPKEELVFTHGDYCFNNFFTDGEDITCYIDMGRGGVGDIYQDIALCVRELGEIDPKCVDLLFKELDIKPDYEKIKYYILLDELF